MQIAEITEDITLDIPIRTFQARVRFEFERNRNEKNLDIINALIFKGTTELIESINVWKQKPHIMNYFENNSLLSRKNEESKSFLRSFLDSNK